MQKIRKTNLRINISENNKHRCEHHMIDIPHEDISDDKKLNEDEFTKFDEEMDGIIDQPYGIKLTSIASDTSPCIW